MSTYKLKLRLIKDKILPNKCSECGLEHNWNNKPINMQLDHINGDPNDDRLENLRLLYPNCHSQTENYCGKNKKIFIPKKVINCKNCNKVLQQKGKTGLCSICCKQHRTKKIKVYVPKLRKRKVVRPNKEELNKLLWSKPTTKIAVQYGVSDKAIEKWAKQYSLSKPGPGFWAKYQRFFDLLL